MQTGTDRFYSVLPSSEPTESEISTTTSAAPVAITPINPPFSNTTSRSSPALQTKNAGRDKPPSRVLNVPFRFRRNVAQGSAPFVERGRDVKNSESVAKRSFGTAEDIRPPIYNSPRLPPYGEQAKRFLPLSRPSSKNGNSRSSDPG
jgi:hypothetical protein